MTDSSDSTASDFIFAHQPILTPHRVVVGYELFDRSPRAADVTRHHTAASDAQLLFNVLSTLDPQSPIGDKTLFINCTHDSLAGGHLELVAPERVVLEIPALAASEVDQIETRLPQLQDVRKRGFRLAFDHAVLTRSYADWLALASYVKFDLSVIKPQTLGSFVKLARAKCNALLVAEKVETEQQVALAIEFGIDLLQGYWFAQPAVVHGQSIRPGQATILQLINLVRQQASTSEIEDVLKRDPALSFNLLRFINSASFGLRTEITSFRHAVMLLGLKRLFKWAALLLTTSADGEGASAVAATAVARGRLMELLGAELLSPDECDNAFVVGIFSMLDTMLGVPMETALGAMNLPASVNQALSDRTGPLAPFLTLTLACETGDDTHFAECANTLGLNSNQINWAHLQALAWAESITQG
ncbi:MAG: HDOD domain-containing protein [Rhodoferax sp.]